MAKILEMPMPKLSPAPWKSGVLVGLAQERGDEIGVGRPSRRSRDGQGHHGISRVRQGNAAQTSGRGRNEREAGSAGRDRRRTGRGCVGAGPCGIKRCAPAGKPARPAEPAQAQEGSISQCGSPGQSSSTPERRPAETMAPPAQRNPVVVNLLERTSYAGEPATTPTNGEQAEGGRVLASPYVRKVARERGIDLHNTHGSGPGGRVVPADLESAQTPRSHARWHAPVTTPAAGAEPDVRPLSPMRKAIARRLTESKSTVPHFYLSIDVDAQALVDLREEINRELSRRARRARRTEYAVPGQGVAQRPPHQGLRGRARACPGMQRKLPRRMRSWCTDASIFPSPLRSQTDW